MEIRKPGDRYQLYVDQQPFYLQGAGLEFGSQEKLTAHGGNSFRTWRTENGQASGQTVLDRALKNGLYVTMGLEIARERHGFDYNDPAAVARQLAEVKAEVLKYQDHPALIIWGIGNELNLNAKNPKVWDAVNEISKMIHQVDTNHLTTTMLAGIGPDLVRQIKAQAADLDLVGIQMYADIINLPRYLRETGWTGPYIVTEWGATGHWEVGKTSWGAPLENDNTTKGIWLNTQRPEWNDANNALVGNGVSTVTLCYLRRYLAFCVELFAPLEKNAISLSAEVSLDAAISRSIFERAGSARSV